ncbi:MAG TPA: hypothetical protein VNY84_14180 [Acidimicrobiales bacterium]|jgi:hypothetical protein|nr:hypothetical protein [Acidimicrobiales bacterium]
MVSRWSDFFVVVGGASAALTGLLFVAVSLRPREIRESSLMIGRARAAFYAFAAVLFTSLIALAGSASRLLGLAELGVVIGVLALSYRFTANSLRARTINYGRAAVYHLGLLVVGAAGAARLVSGVRQYNELMLAVGILLLLGIALSNSWQLVVSHEAGAA